MAGRRQIAVGYCSAVVQHFAERLHQGQPCRVRRNAAAGINKASHASTGNRATAKQPALRNCRRCIDNMITVVKNYPLPPAFHTKRSSIHSAATRPPRVQQSAPAHKPPSHTPHNSRHKPRAQTSPEKQPTPHNNPRLSRKKHHSTDPSRLETNTTVACVKQGRPTSRA